MFVPLQERETMKLFGLDSLHFPTRSKIVFCSLARCDTEAKWPLPPNIEMSTSWMSPIDNMRNVQTHNQAQNHYNNPRGAASSNQTNGQNDDGTGKKKHKR